jgi:catechol 2,3-dioxygenase-like lactoylglutathione lyase family enzyme
LHIGVYTLDIQSSVDFYVRCLDFELLWQGIVPHKTGRLPVATLRRGDCVLELVRPADESRVRRVEGPIQHLAFLVDDLDAAIADLSAKGVPLDEDPELIEYDGGLRHCFVRGPSNERVELCQRLATGVQYL